MAYYLWGGSSSDATYNVSGGLAGGVALEAWNAGSGGTRLTDLKLFTGSYTTEGAAAASGYFPSFSDAFVAIWVPDTVTAVFITGQGSSGRRYALHRIDLDAVVAAIVAAAYLPASAAGTTVATLVGGLVPEDQLPDSAVAGVSSWAGQSGIISTAAAKILLGLATVATSGAYNDLSGKPTIPTTAAGVGAIPSSEKGATGGVAPLDANADVPAANLPIGVSGGVAAHTHTHPGNLADLVAGGTFLRVYSGGAYPARGTTRSDIHCIWVGPTPPSGGSYAVVGVDFNWRTPA